MEKTELEPNKEYILNLTGADIINIQESINIALRSSGINAGEAYVTFKKITAQVLANEGEKIKNLNEKNE